ncbi:putative armadillo-like helical, importin beta family [Helianthus annuus]|nr:putative armadillo-like helical, importin beta family [Helianthus annuus]
MFSFSKTYVGDCLGTLLKTFKAPFLPLFDELLPYLMHMWGKDRTEEEKRIAICIFDETMTLLSIVEMQLYYGTFLPFVLEACNDTSTDVMAYDNVVSALGKIWQVHCDSINVAQIVPAWLNCLPIKGDLIEAKVVHDQLRAMVERFFLLVASEETATRIINLLRQLQQTLPPSAMASTLSSLQPQQLALQSVLSS